MSILDFFSFSLFDLVPFFAGGCWAEYGPWDEDDSNYSCYRTDGFNQEESKNSKSPIDIDVRVAALFNEDVS